MHDNYFSDMLAIILHKNALLSKKEITTALLESTQQKLSLLQYLIEFKVLTAKNIAQLCSRYFKLPYIHLDFQTFTALDPAIFQSYFERYLILPFQFEKNVWCIALSDPQHLSLIDEIQLNIDAKINVHFCDYDQMIAIINRNLSEKIYAVFCSDSNKEKTHELMQQVLNDAILQNASDIHCEPYLSYYRIRFRIDGILHDRLYPHLALKESIVSFIKVKANLDISEKRFPQDGHFHFKSILGYTRDCRISTCPTANGEKVVIRLLSAYKKILALETLGMNPTQQAYFLTQLKKPQGLILVTGPTGSGKTNTLYTALSLLNHAQRNIVTIEDPIEIDMPGINQTTVNRKIKLDFAITLRAFLRQDPDIIMIGEIRDQETAQIAIRAAQTGHLVLSTLHCNSASEAVIRLQNMGIAPYLINSVLLLVISQRLVRLLCHYCKNKLDCHYCHSGFLNRTGIFELWTPSNHYIDQLDLKESALVLVQKNETTLDEINRVI